MRTTATRVTNRRYQSSCASARPDGASTHGGQQGDRGRRREPIRGEHGAAARSHGRWRLVRARGPGSRSGVRRPVERRPRRSQDACPYRASYSFLNASWARRSRLPDRRRLDAGGGRDLGVAEILGPQQEDASPGAARSAASTVRTCRRSTSLARADPRACAARCRRARARARRAPSAGRAATRRAPGGPRCDTASLRRRRRAPPDAAATCTKTSAAISSAAGLVVDDAADDARQPPVVGAEQLVERWPASAPCTGTRSCPVRS